MSIVDAPTIYDDFPCPLCETVMNLKHEHSKWVDDWGSQLIFAIFQCPMCKNIEIIEDISEMSAPSRIAVQR